MYFFIEEVLKEKRAVENVLKKRISSRDHANKVHRNPPFLSRKEKIE